MIAYILFNRATPGERLANEAADRLQREQVNLELVDADSSRGIDLAEHYDILGRPAILLCREDGTLVQAWQGEEEVSSTTDLAYLAHQ